MNTIKFSKNEIIFLNKIKNPPISLSYIPTSIDIQDLDLLINKTLKNGDSFVSILVESYSNNIDNKFLEFYFNKIIKEYPILLITNIKNTKPLNLILNFDNIYLKHEDEILDTISNIYDQNFSHQLFFEIISKSTNNHKLWDVFSKLEYGEIFNTQEVVLSEIASKAITTDDISLLQKIDIFHFENIHKYNQYKKVTINGFSQSIKDNSINTFNYFLNNNFSYNFLNGIIKKSQHTLYSNPYFFLFDNESINIETKKNISNKLLENLDLNTLYDFLKSYNNGLYKFFAIDNLENIFRHAINSQNSNLINLAFKQLFSFPSLMDLNKDSEIFKIIFTYLNKYEKNIKDNTSDNFFNFFNQYKFTLELSIEEQNYFFKTIELLKKHKRICFLSIFNEDFLLNLNYSKPIIDKLNLIEFTSINPLISYMELKQIDKTTEVIDYLEIKHKNLFLLNSSKYINVITAIIANKNDYFFSKLSKNEINHILTKDNIIDYSFLNLLNDDDNFNNKIIQHLLNIDFDFLNKVKNDNNFTCLDYIQMCVPISSELMEKIHIKTNWNIQSELSKIDFNFWKKINNPVIFSDLKKQEIPNINSKFIFDFCGFLSHPKAAINFIELFPQSIYLTSKNKNILEICLVKENYKLAKHIVENHPQIAIQINKKNELPLNLILKKISTMKKELINNESDLINLFFIYMNSIVSEKIINDKLKEKLEIMNNENYSPIIKKTIEYTLMSQQLTITNNSKNTKIKI